MRIGIFKNTDKMSLEQLVKTKNDWTKKINSIKQFQEKYEKMGKNNSWVYRKNQSWIMEAQRLLEKLNQVIQIREMALP